MVYIEVIIGFIVFSWVIEVIVGCIGLIVLFGFSVVGQSAGCGMDWLQRRIGFRVWGLGFRV